MRIALYNIMCGGFDDYASNAATPQRLPALQKAIKKLDADIIGLIDTFRWDEIYTEADLKELFGYKYAYCINLNDERLKRLGHNNGITLLSNVEITQQRTVKIATRDAIMARVHNNKLSFNLVIMYLDDISEDARLEQLRALKSVVNLQEPLLIMGDMNAIKRNDITHTKAPLERFYQQNPEVAKKLAPVVNDMLRGEVIDQFKTWGLRDAGQEHHHPTVPTALFPAKTQQPFLRLDYCFHSPSLPISHFQVPHDNVFQNASDHLPIVFNVA